MAGNGPIPKRTDQRRRQNKPTTPVVRAEAAEREDAPLPDSMWHPKARDWYLALARSGQRRWYEPSDWQQAVVAAEVLSRLLQGARVSAPLLAAWLSMTTGLLATEGDRRRMRIELERGGADEDAVAAAAGVTDIRSRLTGQ